MKLTVRDLYDLHEGLSGLLDKELPTAVAFSVQRNYKKVLEEAATSDEVRNKLADKYKTYVDEEGRFTNAEKQKEYAQELSELMKQEVEIELKTIKIEDLDVSIKPRTLGLLDLIIEA